MNIKLPGDESWSKVMFDTARANMDRSAKDESTTLLKRLQAGPAVAAQPTRTGSSDAMKTSANERRPPIDSRPVGPNGQRPRPAGEKLIPQYDGADTDDSETDEDTCNERINHVKTENCTSPLLTNARSLLPKTEALIAAFDSLELDIACITETWFKPGADLRSKLGDIEGEHGIKIIHKSRDGRTRKAAGGVAVAYRAGGCNLRKREIRSSKNGQEILCVTGMVGKVQRKVAVMVVYVPPDMKAAAFRELSETITTEIAALKVSLGNPVIYVAGDFNHRDIMPALRTADARFQLVGTGPTRGANTLDLVYTNEAGRCVEANVLPPLDTATGVMSDHRCVFVKCEFPKARNYTWVAKFRRTRTKDSEEAFAQSLKEWDWRGLSRSTSVDEMAKLLEHAISCLTDRHFPLARVRRRSNEDPWITRSIRRLWKKKIRIYKKFGKSQSWWETDLKLQREISDAKEFFVERLLEEGNWGRPFYAATKKLA